MENDAYGRDPLTWVGDWVGAVGLLPGARSAADSPPPGAQAPPYQKAKVDVGGVEVNTLVMGSGPPMVLVHGFAAGLAFWVAAHPDSRGRYCPVKSRTSPPSLG